MKSVLAIYLLCFLIGLPVSVCSESIATSPVTIPYKEGTAYERTVFENKVYIQNSTVPEKYLTQEIPWYFIAIHNEPFNHAGKQFFIEESYNVLQRMVAKADSYHIKLTLMFAASWVDFIKEKKEREDEVARWMANGHEIAAHRHSVFHTGNWDGYSAFPLTEINEYRNRFGYRPETCQGSLKTFMEKMKLLDPEMRAGCMNDKDTREVLPDEIIYDTCLGLANYGEFGRPESDMEPTKGRNDYVTVGKYNGIERKWLAHHFMPISALEAQQVFSSMRSGVYGTVNHSAPREFTAFSAYLDFLHRVDQKGIKSKTVSEIIAEKLLPEKRIADTLLAVDKRKEVINKPRVETDKLLRPGQKFLEAIEAMKAGKSSNEGEAGR